MECQPFNMCFLYVSCWCLSFVCLVLVIQKPLLLCVTSFYLFWLILQRSSQITNSLLILYKYDVFYIVTKENIIIWTSNNYCIPLMEKNPVNAILRNSFLINVRDIPIPLLYCWHFTYKILCFLHFEMPTQDD